jgi:2-methylcitrate dehydratase PrpD
MKRKKPGGAISRREFTVGGLTASALVGLGRTLAGQGFQNDAQTKTPTDRPGSAMSKLSGFIANTRYDTIPPRALETAKVAIMDSLGVAIAGAREESAEISGRMIREERAKEEAIIYGQRFKSSAMQAAFVNGTAAHAHDFDHSFVVGGQPTSPIIPAVFALGDALAVSGKQILEAYIIGFEVTARLIFAVQGAGGGGWHANGTIGAFGASAACARLLGLKDSEIEMALGITASMASGVGSNFGTMTKPLHVGLAARNGVFSARLAKAGFTANAQTLEARNGFFDSYYHGGKPDIGVFEDLGRVYALEKYGVRFKPYPCGGLSHTAIFATIRLRNEHQLTPDLVQRVDVEVPADTAAPLVYRVPRTGLEGKFSMPYLIARALLDGKVTLETFTDEAVRKQEVLQLLEKVEMKVDPKLQSGADGSRPATVTIRLKDGQTHSLHQKFPKGSFEVPMTRDELQAKFRACSRGVISDASAERTLAYVDRLETMGSVRPLTELLRGL